MTLSLTGFIGSNSICFLKIYLNILNLQCIQNLREVIRVSKRQIYHVTPHEKGWQVKKEGAERAASIHPTKEEAIRDAVTLAKKADLGQVKIHKRTGEIQEERTYGKDPERYRG
jgi:hypothetical protein